MSTASAFARVGSLLSPFIAMLDVVNPVLPLVVYGVITFASGVSSFWYEMWKLIKAII